MVYSQPPGARRYAYSVTSVVLMMRRRWLAALKWGSCDSSSNDSSVYEHLVIISSRAAISPVNQLSDYGVVSAKAFLFVCLCFSAYVRARVVQFEVRPKVRVHKTFTQFNEFEKCR